MLRRITESGSATPHTFFLANPGASFDTLSARLGGDVAPVQLLQAHREHAFVDDPRIAALDCLVRLLHGHLTLGWAVGRYSQTDAIGAFVSWRAFWDQPECLAIQEAFFLTPPPVGWRPGSIEDPYLLALFERFWASRSEPSSVA